MNCSSTASAREKAIEEKACLEDLKVKSKYLEEAQKKDIERRCLEMEADGCKVPKEIEIAETRARVYEDHAEGSISSRTNHPDSADKVNLVTKKKLKDAEEPVHTKTSSSDASSLNHDLCNLLKIQSAP